MNDKIQKSLKSEGKSFIARHHLENNKAMILEELAWDYAEITPESRMIANCLNISQGFKRDFDDDQILTFISNISFIDKLIESNLSNLKKEKLTQNSVNLV